MCGIVGLIGELATEDATERVARAVRGLSHRGPDGEGLFVQSRGSGTAMVSAGDRHRQLPAIAAGANGCGVAFGHRRLAIIDLTAAAAQPMVSDDGHHVIVFNGEIYNYIELRAELQAAGDCFRTASDTEVLLSGYARWGLQILDRAVGMFAFAIFDRAEQNVLLARDCFGMKPLYYAAGPCGVGFASEPRALLTLTGLRAAADNQGLGDYLVHGLTDHRSGTMFAEVCAVPPASYIRVGLTDARVSGPVRYWAPATDRIDDRPPAAIARDLRERFLHSVRLHLRSEQRVGTLLSGGIDSSAIVMAVREVAGPRVDICTFSFIPDGGAISEEPWIDEVNRAAGATPHKVRITRDGWEAEAGVLAEHQGEPFGSLAVHAQSALFRCAADHGVRVLLDGQGADEALGGYSLFRGVRLAGHVRRAECGHALRVAWGLAAGAPSIRSAVRSYVDGLRVLAPARASDFVRRAHLRSALAREAWLRARGIRARDEWRSSARRPLQERLREAIEITSLPALLRYADRAAMMHGVESRLPFLTRELVQLALTLPDHLLVSDDGIGKAIFRDAMRGLVPDSVLNRREKVGFSVPLRDWLLGSRYVRDRVASALHLPCVESRQVRSWLDDLTAGRPLTPRRTFLTWRLISLVEWIQRYDVAIA